MMDDYERAADDLAQLRMEERSLSTCPITRKVDCEERSCELHYMLAPLALGLEYHRFVESGPGQAPTSIRGCIVCPACYQTASADVHRRPS